MILIKKNSEPRSLTEYKKTVNSSFDNLPSNVKNDIRESLLKEQGYICAYCMKRIESPDVKIEHYKARNSENELDYKNLLAVCKGNEGSPKKFQTCDTHKGNDILNINPQDERHILTIFFTRNGEIKSSNDLYQKELNEVLNLNDKYGKLISGRRAALKALQNNIKKKNENKIKKLYQSLKNEKIKTEYVGILLWYLEDKSYIKEILEK